MSGTGNGTTPRSSLNSCRSVRELLARGELVAAARREAEAAERDGYDVTADLLRQLADAVEARVMADRGHPATLGVRP